MYLYRAFEGKRKGFIKLPSFCEIPSSQRMTVFNFNDMKEIQLSQHGKNRGKYVALVDDEDYERVNQYPWSIARGKYSIYAQSRILVNGIYKAIQMHTFITDNKISDHMDHDGLNNQKSNLRNCTNSQNLCNRRKFKNKSSKYKGVSWHIRYNTWVAYIVYCGKLKTIGCYKVEEDAAMAYDTAAKNIYKEFAYVNFK